MASVVDICNFALQELGGEKITSINEGTPSAIECNLKYDQARRALLSMHPWNFAIKRATLNKEVAAPEFTYTYQYTLPADFLSLVMTGLEERYQSPSPQVVNSYLYVSDVPSYGGIDKYRVEDGKILTFDDNLQIIYVFDQTDTQKFSATFTELLVRYLCFKMAYKITGSKSERDTQAQIFKDEFNEFQTLNARQGIPDRLEVSKLLSEIL